GFFVASSVFLIGMYLVKLEFRMAKLIVSYAVAFSMTGFAATYLRFFPSIKKNYDYGVVIFLLTFNLITVSSFRQENILPLARDRLSTIAIGCAICLFMSLFVLPNWSGEDLHSRTAHKFEGLARSVEGCVNEYFRDQEKHDNILDKQTSRASIHTGYREVLDSKSSDESLVIKSSFDASIFLSFSPCNCFYQIDVMDVSYFKKYMPSNNNNWPGTLCKLGAKTLNAVLQLPMAKVCEARICA
uniref:Uncharacterized protein n=1 Tax=Aegilops tauschii subsp. strangulata TaxID=200361 RepID=A0A452YPP4_AEGTS